MHSHYLSDFQPSVGQSASKNQEQTQGAHSTAHVSWGKPNQKKSKILKNTKSPKCCENFGNIAFRLRDIGIWSWPNF